MTDLSADIPLFSDPLGEVLHQLKITGTLYCQSELQAPWGVEFPLFDDCLMFHMVLSGSCWLEVPGQPSRQLQEGDLVLIPHGHGHQIRSTEPGPVRALSDIPVDKVSERLELLHWSGEGALTQLTCGVARFDSVVGQELAMSLPAVIHVQGSSTAESSWLHSSLDLIVREAGALRAGSETLITQLADLVIIQAIRFWLDASRDSARGWIEALQDKQIGRVLAAVHREPGADWSLETMAAVAGMSRSVFTQRFTALLQEPAMRYVTRWRMQLARSALRESADPMIAIAEQLGYGSESAFSRAFSRQYGISPGQFRSGKAG